jgi:hypothetical protein
MVTPTPLRLGLARGRLPSLPENHRKAGWIAAVCEHCVADLASIRDSKVLAKLAPNEQEACKKLWADVAELLKKVEEKPK